MIIRHVARRQGSAFLRSAAAPAQTRAWRRTYASEVDSLEAVERSLNSSVFETQSIEASLQSSTSRPVTRFSGQLHQQLDPETSKIAQRHRQLQHQGETSGTYGAVVGKHYKPHELLNNPPFPSDLTPELLLASQTHLGHATSLWNPMNSRYIYGIRDGIHIIALEETLAHLRRACRVVKGVAERAGLVLFVGTRRGQDRSVVQAAHNAGGYHLFEKWIPGSITNGNQILGTCRKRVVDMFDKEVTINEDSLAEIPALKPDLVIVLNPLENRVLLNECALHSIPTVGIIDTDADPTCVTYPIPANDDSLRCTTVIAGVLGRAGQEGQASRRARAKTGEVLYEPLQLPENTVLGEAYKTELQEEGLPVEYINKDGRVMTTEEIEEAHRQGIVVDRSLMTVYNDNDGGDPFAEMIHRVDEETGELVPELTEAGGAPPGAFNPSVLFTQASKEPETAALIGGNLVGNSESKELSEHETQLDMISEQIEGLKEMKDNYEMGIDQMDEVREADSPVDSLQEEPEEKK